MPLDKSKLGNRFACFACGTKFYDLNRPVPTCPECGADQTEAPVQDLKALLSRSGKRPIPKPEPELESESKEEDGSDDGLFESPDAEEEEEEDEIEEDDE